MNLSNLKTMFLHTKALAGLVLAVFIFYQVGCDTVWKGALADVASKEAKQAELKQTRDTDRQRTNDLYALEQQVLALKVTLASVPAGSSPRVKAVSIIDDLKQALQGLGSTLVEENLTLTPPQASDAAAPFAASGPAMPPKANGTITVVSLLPKDPVQADLLGEGVPPNLKISLPNQTLPPMPVWNYPFTLTVKGDVVNVVKLVNVVAAHNPLIVINKLELKREAGTGDTSTNAFIQLPQGSSTPTQGPTPLNQLPAQLMAALFNNTSAQALVSPEATHQDKVKAESPQSLTATDNNKAEVKPSLQLLPPKQETAPPASLWQQTAPVTLQLELSIYIVDPSLSPQG